MRSPVNFEELLNRARIPFITHGKNVKRGNLNIHCAFCGSADPSFHMGIDPDNGWWACWRNEDHRGKSPVRLLMRTLGMGYNEARGVCGLGDDYVDPDGFGAFMNKLRNPVVAEVGVNMLMLPEDCRPITDTSIRTRHHWNYLCGPSRAFTPLEVPHVVRQFNLLASLDYRWKDRVILPYYEDAKLVAWTARAITKSAEIRYKDLSLAECVVPIKHTLYNAPAMYRKGRGLLLVEGPFDAVKADYHGRPHGIRAVALSTATISDQQLYRISQYAHNFEWIGVCLDQSTELQALLSTKMAGKLAHLKTPVHTIKIPATWKSKDFGGATGAEAAPFLSQLASGHV